MDQPKQEVYDFWNAAACGEVYATGASARERFEAHRAARYALEPYLPGFARFAEGAGRDVLEVGVGLGADHVEWAKVRPRRLAGIDLTPRAVVQARARLALYDLHSDLEIADAEALPFRDGSFDLVYSWGVLHHSPDTARAVAEVHRVLRPGGGARVMIYHKHSVVGALLWLRYGLAAGRPRTTWDEIYARHLESPGTKAYSVAEARALFGAFRQVTVGVQLGMGDLLQGAVGQRHRGPLLSLAKALWPRFLIKRLCRNYGLGLMIEAVK
jgi:ubiquinone/menaquinone biosynthesis C-methylase UbiE